MTPGALDKDSNITAAERKKESMKLNSKKKKNLIPVNWNVNCWEVLFLSQTETRILYFLPQQNLRLNPWLRHKISRRLS